MRRVSGRAACALVLSVVIAFAWAVPAVAGTAYSNWSNFTCGSYGYQNRAKVETLTYAVASTYIGSNPSVTRPAGWYGALARLYNDSGVLVAQSGYSYNGTAGLGMELYTGAYTVHGSYYSYGVSKSWTGSAYHGHATWTSPRQSF